MQLVQLLELTEQFLQGEAHGMQVWVAES